MASFSIPVSDAFAAGATVGAYPESNWPAHNRPPTPGTAPLGSATQSVTVAASGTATFDGLTEDTTYYISTSAGARYVRFRVDAAAPVDANAAAEALNVRDAAYGATGNGTTDDRAALVAANTAAAAAGKALKIPKGTYIVSSAWSPTVSVFAEPGATIKKKASSTTFAITVGTANIEIRGLAVDGNRSGGATSGGIAFDTGATNGVLRDVTVKNTKGDGIGAYNSADLRCYGCESSDNWSGTGTSSGTGHGFKCDSGAKLRQFNCLAQDNDGDGVNILNTSADGCLVDCRVNRNVRFGACIRADKGTIKHLSGTHNNAFGVVFGVSNAAVHPTGWNVEYIEMAYTGAAYTNSGGGSVVANGQATAVELYGTSRTSFGTVIARGSYGYGVALTKESAGGVGCSNIQFGTIVCDQTGGEQDPALHISASSQITVGTLQAAGHSFAVTLGEDVEGDVTDCVIDTVIANGISYAIWRCDSSGAGTCKNNRINQIVGRDCINTNTNTSSGWPGLLTFGGAATTDNVVGLFRHRQIGATAPNATIYQKTSATKNYIADLTGARASLHRVGLRPAVAVAEATSRESVTNIASALVSGTVYVTQTVVPGGTPCAGAVFCTGTTAVGVPTNQWFALVRISDRTVMAVTADDTSTAWAASAQKSLNFAAPWTPEQDTNCWLAVMVAAGTPPTLTGLDMNSIPSTLRSTAPVLGGVSDTGKTTPYAVGDVIAAPTNSRIRAYAYVI